MANSSIMIQYNAVPEINNFININESNLNINLNEIFKQSRLESGQTLLPFLIPFGDYINPGDYIGYVSSNYKEAFNLDYNTADLFTIDDYPATDATGVGVIIITANYPDAFFSYTTDAEAVSITVNNQGEGSIFSFTPNNLTFVHKQNEPRLLQIIAITGNLWKIVAKNNFILSSSTPSVSLVSITDSSGTYFVASGSGNAVIGIGLSEYYDSEAVFTGTDLAGSFNVFKNDVQFGVINYMVSVSRLSDFFQIPYPSGQKAFTLDPIFFNFQSTNTDTYFQFNALIKTYDFFTDNVTENTLKQKIVLFKAKSKVNIGQVIHRLMRKFNEVNDSLLQYQFAKVQLSVAEKLILDDSIVRSGTSAVIPFVAGLSRGFTDFGFLEFNPKPNRVTQKSFAYLNILIPVGSYELRTLKNGIIINTEALPTNANTTLCKKVQFNSFNQGDVIEYVIDIAGQNNTNVPKKTFCIFPDSNYSNMIVWENEFKMQSAIECTGIASLDPDLEFQSQKVYQNLVETLEHLASSKDVKLYIDTGWILFTDIDTIESLMRSKRAWLIQDDKEISLRPIGKQLPKQDYENELISFPLEFTINRAYDEETYTL
jgi:hypothetical protein